MFTCRPMQFFTSAVRRSSREVGPNAYVQFPVALSIKLIAAMYTNDDNTDDNAHSCNVFRRACDS